MPVIDDSHALPPTSALPSIADAVDRIAGANPGYPAIALVRNTQTFEGHYVETTSWGELAALSKRAAYFLTAPEHGINLKHGSTVAVWCSNRTDTWMASFLACARIGAIVLNLNPRFREGEMAHFLKTADPDLIILENGLLGVDYARMAIEVAPNGGKKMAILNLGTGKGMPDTTKYPRPVITLPPGFSFDAPDPLPELPPNCRGNAHSPVVCFSTSGTTGPSKLALHTQFSVMRSAVDIAWNWDLRSAKGTVMEGKLKYGKVLDYGGRKEVMELDVGLPTLENRCRDVNIIGIPYCGAFGFHIVFSTLLGAGGTIVMLDGYNPDIAAYYLHNYSPLPMPDPPMHLRGGTHICVPDAVHGDMFARAHLYGRIPKNGEQVPWEERPYRRWRFALTSNFANTAKQMIKLGLEVSPHAFMMHGYGMSETMASIGHWSRFESLEQTADGWRQIAQPDPEITGRAGGRLNNLVEMDVKVINPDTLEDQPPGLDTPGEICLRGPQISISYLNNEAATLKSRIPAVASDPDKREWFRSGDFGYLCGPSRLDGFAFLNRMGDTLRLRGFLTNPGEIEDLIKTHPAIREAQVVGCPPTVTVGGVVQEASNTGDVAVAFVILHEQGKNEEAVSRDVIALCKEKLANYKVPQAVFFVTEYPVTQAANGTKIQKHRLRDMAKERGVTLSRGQGVSGPKLEARL